MTKLAEHPTVQRVRSRRPQRVEEHPAPLDADELRRLVLEAGADDVGFVEVDRPELADQREEIRRFFPPAKSLISFVCRLNREPTRNPARSVSNNEFHHTGEYVNDVARRIVGTLERRGIRAVNPSMGFPMEMDRFPGKVWVVSHKPVAVAAGLGHMGIHRNVIHPKFGNFILLGTIVLDREISEHYHPIDYNPCLNCKLCVKACPVGAISPEGDFNFSACYTHNYREFMGGFTNWVEQIANAKNASEYRRQVSDPESASMWQSLSFGPNYKAAYCIAVCPAGEDVIGAYLNDKAGHFQTVVRPLTDKEETVYVVPGSDAESHVTRHFPHKKPKRVGNGIRTRSIASFLRGLPLAFQPEKSEGLDATYHFTFTGDEECKATVVIRDKTVEVSDGHIGPADLAMIADTATWLGFLAKERSLIWALLTRRVRLKGSPKLLAAFGKCFPS